MPVEEIIRTKTGIQGLDVALHGGFPQGNIVLISGGAGTGKSTFCLQYLINGATLFGEKGLYVSTEQSREELYKQANGFNWKLGDLEQRNLIKIVFFDPTDGDDFPTKFAEICTAFQPKRIVVDSLTTLTDSLIVSGFNENKSFSLVQIAETVNPIPRTEQIVTKNILYSLFKVIRKFKVTTLLTTEMPEEGHTLSADGVSEFIADGVLTLSVVAMGDTVNRTIMVRKMRYTPIEAGIKSYDITESGISIE